MLGFPGNVCFSRLDITQNMTKQSKQKTKCQVCHNQVGQSDLRAVFCAVTSCSSVVTLQFGFCWHK